MFPPWTWQPKRVPARHRRGLRPQIEVLEDRLQPSVVAASPSDAKINTSSPLDQTEPSVAMDANGDYVIAWNNQVHLGPNYLYDIDARVYNSAGQPQTGEIVVAQTTGDTRPSVAMDANGDFVVAYQVLDTTTYLYGISAQRFNLAGTPRGSTITVNDGSSMSASGGLPKVAMDSAGDFTIAFQGYDSNSHGVFAQQFNSSGVSQGAIFRVNTPQSDNQGAPTIAMDSAGDFVITWEDGGTAQNAGIYAQRYNSSGAAQGSNTAISTVTSGSSPGNPSVAMEPTGQYAIAWQFDQTAAGAGNSFQGIETQRFDASGNALTSVVQLNTPENYEQGNPTVAIDSEGDFIVAWASYGQGGTQSSLDTILAQRVNAAGTLIGATQFLPSTQTGDNQRDPAVASDPDGNTMIVWESKPSTSSSDQDVYGRLYDYVNDAPTINTPSNVTILENAGQQTVNLTGITPGGGETQTLTVTTSSNNTALVNPTITYTSPNSTGTLKFTPSANSFGTATITVSVMDNGGTQNGARDTASVQFIVTVNHVNVAPTIDTPSNVTINENAGQQTVNLTGITAGGGETQTLTVTASSNNTALVNPSVTYTSPNSTGSLSFTPSANSFGIATITVTVMDNGGTQNGARDTTSVQFIVTVNQVVTASPTLSSTPSTTTVTVGTTAPTLKDTATLASGSSETGTITFTLYYNGGGSAVDTETVSVSGDGSYTTPSGYTLPGTGTVTGTYQWDASYSGDGNNYSTSENSATAERVAVNPASPTISSTPSTTAVTLGTTAPTLTDTAALASGYSDTGTITLTLYYNGGGSAVDTETISVSGNGSYTTPSGYTLPLTGATVTGTYQWDASYSGDGNNNSTSENSATAERVTVNSASPTLTTTPSATTVTLGTTAQTLKDTASLANAYDIPAGVTITFTLYNPSNSLVDTETVSVSGNGSYTTPSGYTLPPTGTVTGTYQWDASYSGNGNNNATSENSATAERVAASPASPTLSTTPSTTAVTLGTTAATLSETAALASGYSDTGTITFTLYYNGGGSAVDTETVSVSGNDSYTTPSGYTLPLTGATVTGTYQWDASYSGDGNNNSTSENSATAERVTVNSASPTLTTTPSTTAVTLGTTAPTLTDTAGLAGGYSDTGTITFTLYYNGGGSAVDTETISVSGNGSYTTPSGYILALTGATVTGTYQWDASYSGDGNNNLTSENSASSERIVVSAASPTLATTPSAATVTLGTTAPTLNDTAVLSPGSNETGTITFTLYNPGGSLVDTETVSVSGNGSYTTPSGYTLPITETTVTGTYQWDASYSGDNNNNSTSENTATAERVVVNAASPTLATTPSAATVTLVTTAPTLNDTATLSAGSNETGTITFTLYNPGGSLVDTETVLVSGNSLYTTPSGYTLPATGTVTGTYQWDASYSGDNNNNSTGENSASAERVAVIAASPIMVTTPSPTSVTLGTTAITLKDSGALSVGYFETGTITFKLYNPNGTVVDTETVTVCGSGNYTTPSGYTLPTTGAATGAYQWDASYSGNGNNQSTNENSAAAEQVAVIGLPTVTSPTFTSVTTTGVTLGGDVTNNGGASLIKRGIAYSLTSINPNPILGGTGVHEVDDGSQTTGVFADLVSRLTKTTKYSFVAFATNAAGTGYTPVALFVTAPASFITGPSTGRPGQALSFTLFASDPTPLWQGYYFTFHINWGDGTISTLTELSGATTTHTYKTAGVYTITISATDGNSTILPSESTTITISSAPTGGASAIPSNPSTGGNTLAVAAAKGIGAKVPATPLPGNAATPTNGVSQGTIASPASIVLSSGEDAGGEIAAAVSAIMAEWTSSDDNDQLMADLLTGVGAELNADASIGAGTVDLLFQ